MNEPPAPDNDFLAVHVARLNESHKILTGAALVEDELSARALAEKIFNAPFVVLSSGLEPDPLFNYANFTALRLFELDWATLIKMPARESAEPIHQDRRAALMAQVQSRGFIDNYCGVRVSASGRRFRIERATVWNVVNQHGEHFGQAATFAEWREL